MRAIPNMRAWHVSGGSCDSQVSQEEKVWLCVCPGRRAEMKRREVRISDRLISVIQLHCSASEARLEIGSLKPPSRSPTSRQELQQRVPGW